MNDPYIDEDSGSLKYPEPDDSQQLSAIEELDKIVFKPDPNPTQDLVHDMQTKLNILNEPLVTKDIPPKSDLSAPASKVTKSMLDNPSQFILRLNAREDAMVKCEKFAIKLRKQKKKEILARRREALARLIQKVRPIDTEIEPLKGQNGLQQTHRRPSPTEVQSRVQQSYQRTTEPHADIIQIESTDLDSEPQQCKKPDGGSYTRFNEMPISLINELLLDEAEIDIYFCLEHRRKAILLQVDEDHRRQARQIIDRDYKRVSGGFIERYERQKDTEVNFEYLIEQAKHWDSHRIDMADVCYKVPTRQIQQLQPVLAKQQTDLQMGQHHQARGQSESRSFSNNLRIPRNFPRQQQIQKNRNPSRQPPSHDDEFIITTHKMEETNKKIPQPGDAQQVKRASRWQEPDRQRKPKSESPPKFYYGGQQKRKRYN